MKARRASSEVRRMKAADAVGVPEKESATPWFDPDTDITEQDWQWLRGQFADTLMTPFMRGQFAEFVSIAGPDRIRDFSMSEYNWKQAANRIQTVSQVAFDIPEAVMQLLLLDASRKQQLKFDKWCNAKYLQSQLESSLDDKETISDGDVMFHLQARMLAKIHFPEQKQKGLTAGEKERVTADIKHVLKNRGYRMFSRLVVPLILAYPEMKEEISLTERDRDSLLEAFHEAREGRDLNAFLLLGECLAVLSADDARISPDGRIMVARKEPLKESLPMPERPAV